MGISTEGDWGSGAHSTSASSFTFATATTALSANTGFGLLVVVTDNVSASSGETNLHMGVSGGTGTWTKLGEYTNGQGAAAAGVTVSLWLFEATGTMSTGTTVTITLSEAVVDKTCSGHVFAKDSDKLIRMSPGTTPQFSEVAGTTGFGSSSFSGLSSLQRLFIRALGKEANSTGNITPTSSYGTFGAQRSRNHADAVLVRGERRVVTATSATSNPTFSTSGDGAGIFVALEEYTPTGAVSGSGGGTLSFSLSGSGTAVSDPVGSGAGQLTFALGGTGTSVISGALSAGVGFTASAQGKALAKGEGLVAVDFTLQGQGSEGLPVISGTGQPSLGFSISGTGGAVLTGQGSGSLALAFDLTGLGKSPTIGQGGGELGLSLNALGQALDVTHNGVLAAEIGFACAGEGSVPARGMGALLLLFAVSGTSGTPELGETLRVRRNGFWKTRKVVGPFSDRERTGVGRWKTEERSGAWY